MEDAKLAQVEAVEAAAAAATARLSVSRKKQELRPTVELLYDPEDGSDLQHWLGDIVFMFTLPVPVAGGEEESEPFAFIQWHEFVKVADGVDVEMPCNVTQLGEQYTVVQWTDILKTVLVVPQLSKIPHGVFERVPVDAPVVAANGTQAVGVMHCIRPIAFSNKSIITAC